MVNTIFTILFLVLLDTGVKGILYAQIIAGILELSVLYSLTWGQMSFHFSFSSLSAMLSFSVFLVPTNLSSFVLSYSNRYFLNEYMNLEEVGLYSLGAKMAGIIPFLFTEPVKKAFGPHIFNLIEEPEKCKRQLADFSRAFFFFLACVALFVSLFSREAVALLADESYLGSYNIVFILAMSYLLIGLAGIVVVAIHIKMKTWIVSLIWPLSAAVNILANMVMIPAYGRYGAAIATLVSTAFIAVSYFVAVHVIYRTRFAYLKMLTCLVLMIVINYVGQMLNLLPFMPAVLLKSVLFFLFIVILISIGYFTRNEIDQAKEFLAARVDSFHRKIKRQSRSEIKE